MSHQRATMRGVGENGHVEWQFSDEGMQPEGKRGGGRGGPSQHMDWEAVGLSSVHHFEGGKGSGGVLERGRRVKDATVTHMNRCRTRSRMTVREGILSP